MCCCGLVYADNKRSHLLSFSVLHLELERVVNASSRFLIPKSGERRNKYSHFRTTVTVAGHGLEDHLGPNSLKDEQSITLCVSVSTYHPWFLVTSSHRHHPVKSSTHISTTTLSLSHQIFPPTSVFPTLFVSSSFFHLAGLLFLALTLSYPTFAATLLSTTGLAAFGFRRWVISLVFH